MMSDCGISGDESTQLGSITRIDERQLVRRVASCVQMRMAGQQAGHGFDHVLRVLKLAREIQDEVGGNRLIIELAALLHDIGDAKFNQGADRSAEYSVEILSDLGASTETSTQVADIVDKISFRKAIDKNALSWEGKIVQDADRLDALGAIGVVRTIEYGAVMGQPFYLPDGTSEGIKTGVGHFHEKLFKLCELLNTAPAKRIAKSREQFMRTFLSQFLLECGELVSEQAR